MSSRFVYLWWLRQIHEPPEPILQQPCDTSVQHQRQKCLFNADGYIRSFKKDVLGHLTQEIMSDVFWVIYRSELSCLLSLICVLCLCSEV